MERKIDTLRAMMNRGDWNGALRLASTFARLGTHRTAIIRGHEAFTNPRFYESIHKNPDALIAEGIAALKARYQQ